MASESNVKSQLSNVDNGYISNPIELVKPSWEALKVNFGTLLIAVLMPLAVAALAVVAIFVLGVASRTGGGALALGLTLLLGLIALVLVVLLIPVFPLTLLKSVRGEKISFREAYEQGRPFVLRLIGIGILTALAVLGGFILLIIPGLIFTAWFALGAYVCIDENKGVVESMKRSKQLVTGHVWEMWGMIALPSVVGIINIIPVLGWIISTIFQVAYLPAQALRYDQLKATEGKPSQTHWVNYVVSLLFPVVLVLTSGFSSRNQQNPIDTQIQDAINQTKQ